MKRRLLIGILGAMAAMLMCTTGTAQWMDDEGEGAGVEQKAPKQKKQKKQRQPRVQKAKKPATPLEDLTLTGTVEKVERKGKGDKTQVSYVLNTADFGKVTLRKTKDVDPANFVGMSVVAKGKGRTIARKDKKRAHLMKLISLEKAEGDAGAAGEDAGAAGEDAGAVDETMNE